MNKILRTFSLISFFAVAALSTSASAAVVIDFSTGTAGFGGVITDVNGDGSHIIGEDIGIGLLTVGGGAAGDGLYNTDAVLNFDTDENTIEIVGTVAGLGNSLGSTSRQLLSGSFSSWEVSAFNGEGLSFSGGGVDFKDANLLQALGLDIETEFQFFGFSLAFDVTGTGVATAVSTDIVNTTVVPVPAAAWLFGSGLIGLVGVARRQA